MNKLIFLVPLLVLNLSACEPSARQITFRVVPEELKDCKFYNLHDISAGSITIVRCPKTESTSTNYNVGKSKANKTLIQE